MSRGHLGASDATFCGWGYHRWQFIPAKGVLVDRWECLSCRSVEPAAP